MNGIKEVLSVRRYKAGYVVEERLIDGSQSGGSDFTMKVAVTPTGEYIGRQKIAYLLCTKRGIKPELISPDRNVCSIGFSERHQKWYGWSHRALFGFEVGSVVKEDDCTASSGWTDEYLAEHPEDNTALPVGFTAKTMDDAKRMAVAFAESVG